MRSVFACLLTSIACFAAQQQRPPDAAADGDKSRDLKYTAPANPEPGPSIPRSYALVVGISKYKNLPASAQLLYPDRDAQSVYTILISAEGGQFPPENVHKLIGERATLANLKYELETWLPSVTKADDRVLIYFAGHGFISNGRGYLAPYDMLPSAISTTAYSMDELGTDAGSKISGKWKVILTDACHSGAIVPEADRAQLNRSLLDLNKSLFSLTASRDREQSFESKNWGAGHGIFTYYVVKGMEGEADTNSDGVVTADELGEYVHGSVRQATNGQQNPTSERGSFDPEMVLAYNPMRAKNPLSTAAKTGTLILETNMDGVEIWVDGVNQGLVNRATPLRLPGLQPGAHIVKGIRMGYEPDGPREQQIYPGQETTVNIRILIAKPRKRSAMQHFDKGIEFYNKGYEQNYKHAIDEFKQALAIDGDYSQAALYLGRCYSAVYDVDNARQSMKLAVEIDPDYLEAKASYGGVLLDAGDLDEAIRQLNGVTNRETDHAMAWYLMSQAYARKGDYADGVRAGERAIRLSPGNAEAHFWLAESLRQLNQAAEAETEYNRYLKLSDFESKLAGKLNYYVMGYLIGTGVKKRAAQEDIWKELRGQANLGICDCEWMQKRIDVAIQYCHVALSYDRDNLFSHYRLGTLYAQKFNNEGGLGLLAAARKHFGDVVSINSDTAEAERARKYIANIDQVLAKASTVN